MLLRPHRSLQCDDRITPADSRKRQNEIASFRGIRGQNLAISKPHSLSKSDSCSTAYELFTADYVVAKEKIFAEQLLDHAVG
jgi:hypothetical protein